MSFLRNKLRSLNVWANRTKQRKALSRYRTVDPDRLSVKILTFRSMRGFVNKMAHFDLVGKISSINSGGVTVICPRTEKRITLTPCQQGMCQEYVRMKSRQLREGKELWCYQVVTHRDRVFCTLKDHPPEEVRNEQ